MAVFNKVVEFLDVFMGFRKFSIMAMVLISSVILLLRHFLDGGQWVSLMTVVVPAYMATNSVEHITNAAQTWFNSRSTINNTTTSTTTITPPPDQTPVPPAPVAAAPAPAPATPGA